MKDLDIKELERMRAKIDKEIVSRKKQSVLQLKQDKTFLEKTNNVKSLLDDFKNTMVRVSLPAIEIEYSPNEYELDFYGGFNKDNDYSFDRCVVFPKDCTSFQKKIIEQFFYDNSFPCLDLVRAMDKQKYNNLINKIKQLNSELAEFSNICDLNDLNPGDFLK